MTINLRFIVVTDGHWGDSPNNTSKTYQELHADAVSRIDAIHAERDVDFVVHNGDIVHDDESLHSEVITNFFDQLPSGVDWYAVPGNHDWATESEWQSYYGHSRQHTFEYDDYGFIITDTAEPRESNWYCADASWLEAQIDAFADKTEVFVFNHIAPATAWDQYGVDCPDVRTQLARDEVTATFLGHNHPKNGVETHSGATYVYAGRYGGYSDGPLGLRVVDITV